MDPNQNQNSNPGQSFSPTPQPSEPPQPQPTPQPVQSYQPEQQPTQFAPQPDVAPPAPALSPAPAPAMQEVPASPAPSQPYAPAPMAGQGQAYAPQSNQSAGGEEENPHKSYLVALLLSWLLGSLGVDRFYLGKIGTGVAKLLTFGGLGIWVLVDLLLIAFGKLRAKDDNRPLEGFAKNRSWVKLVSIILIVFYVILYAVIFFFVIIGTIAGVQQQAQEQEDYVTQQTTERNSAVAEECIKDPTFMVDCDKYTSSSTSDDLYTN